MFDSVAIRKIMEEFPGYLPTRWGTQASFNNATNVTYLVFKNPLQPEVWCKKVGEDVCIYFHTLAVSSVCDRGYWTPNGCDASFKGRERFVPFDEEEKKYLRRIEGKYEECFAYFRSLRKIPWGEEWNREKFVEI